jgi:hypothetical protein
MQGIYTYIPETNHVPKEYNVAAVLSLLFMAPISLAPELTLTYFYISTYRSMCAVPNMALFCSSVIIITTIIITSFVQGIYTHIPETNNVPKEYKVAAILSLLFMVSISLALALALMYFYISTLRSM